MSWHFSQALVAVYLRAPSWDGAVCAPLKSTGTDGPCSEPDRMMARLIPSRSGMTSAPSTDCPGAVELTWYLAGFPVRPIPARLEAETSRTISGRRCGESWQRQLPGTYSPRTSHAKQSTPPQTTYKRWVTPSAVFPFPRQTWVVTTFGAATGFVHTPTETANYMCPSMMKWPGCREFVRVFGQPTPVNAEWLMDWPIGWTALAPLAKDKLHAWRTRHGA